MKKLSPEQLISYLYNEVSETEKKEIEAILAQSPEIQAELEELKASQTLLQEAEEVNPPSPLVLFDLPQKEIKTPKSYFARNLLAVAASVTLLLIAVSFMKLRISSEQGKWQVSFGDVPPVQVVKVIEREPSGSNLTMQQVQNWVNQTLAQQNDSLNQTLVALKQKTMQIPAKSSYTDAEVQQLVNAVTKEHTDFLVRIMEANAKDQRIYTEKLLSSFAQYVEAQRQQDLNDIGLSINNIQLNTAQRFQATDQVLASIITEVKDKN